MRCARALPSCRMARPSPIESSRIATGGPDPHAPVAARSSRRTTLAVAARTSARAARSCPLPELPEVETTARGLRARVLGLRVQAFSRVDWPRMLPQTSEDELNAVLA